MKHLSLLIMFLFIAFLTQAQVKISGIVKDNHNKKVISASITIKDTYDGATSDSSGNYAFTTTEKGSYTLVASAVGYKTVEQTILVGNEPIAVNFNIKEEINELKAVTVTAGSFAAGDSKRAVTVLNSIDVATVGGGN